MPLRQALYIWLEKMIRYTYHLGTNLLKPATLATSAPITSCRRSTAGHACLLTFHFHLLSMRPGEDTLKPYQQATSFQLPHHNNPGHSQEDCKSSCHSALHSSVLASSSSHGLTGPGLLVLPLGRWPLSLPARHLIQLQNVRLEYLVERGMAWRNNARPCA